MFPSLDQAISQFEGFGQPGTIATRQNNPGNLIYGPFAQSMGATGPGTNNIAVFPNNQTGFSAMDSLIQHYASSGYNLQQLIGAWAPGNAPGNSPQSQSNYTNYVAKQAGATPQTPVSALSQGNTPQCAWWDYTCHIATSAPVQAVGNAASKTGLNPFDNISQALSGWSFGRVATIAVGLIAIGGSIILFRGGDIIETVKGAVPIAAA